MTSDIASIVLSDVTAILDSEPPRRATLTITRDVVAEPAARTVVDPRWVYVDQAGHFHAAAADGTVPTLVWHETRTYDRFAYLLDTPHTYPLEFVVTGGHWRCAVCAEQISPETAAHTDTAGWRAWSVLLQGVNLADGGRHTVRVTTPSGQEVFGVARAVPTGQHRGTVPMAMLVGEGVLAARPAPARQLQPAGRW
ncbi:hypothetical protein [Dactylosporangium sp. CS-033363]|uniref:hypothetical protein n=1 Tax=Dactylosporangium sp. CS-033363 TaxID=3239935 RepID=UPI003D8D9AA8